MIIEGGTKTSEDKIEFKILDNKLVGNDTVVFKLEDGAMAKIKVSINRAGIAINFKNPDGSPHYNINADLRIVIIPAEKKYFIPKSRIPTSQFPSKESTVKPV